ncbi:MAG: hypothetical protein LM571_06940 [Desulfurococcaceae archaeon]|nr:hypothetical protein [Desulfurococcaceae archaeon]
MEEILRTAVRLGITTCDSSYVVLARRCGPTLVTEDIELRAKVRGLVRCVSVDELGPPTA